MGTCEGHPVSAKVVVIEGATTHITKTRKENKREKIKIREKVINQPQEPAGGGGGGRFQGGSHVQLQP